MGEGLGAGGHATRRYLLNAGSGDAFLAGELFSGCGPTPRRPPARVRPIRQIGRQIDVATVGKLEVSQVDAKPTSVAAATLDHIARADRKTARQTIKRRTHGNLQPELAPAEGCNAGSTRQFRDSAPMRHGFL
jgi:hypothetical protein